MKTHDLRTHDDPPLPEPVKEVPLHLALALEGFPIPEGCANVRLTMLPQGNVFVLSYDVVVKEADLARVGRALARVGEGNDD